MGGAGEVWHRYRPVNLCFWRPAWRGASASPKVLGGSLGHLPPGEGDRRARALLPNLKVLKKTRSERTDQTREPKGTRTLDSEGSGWASGGRRRPVLVKNVIVVDSLRPVSGPVSGRSPVQVSGPLRFSGPGAGEFLRSVSGPVSGRSPVLRSRPRPGPEKTVLRSRARAGPETRFLRSRARVGPETRFLRSRARVGPETRFLRSRARVGPETWQGRGLDSPTFGQGARAFKGNSVLREGC